MTASAHVLVFRPLIALLRERGGPGRDPARPTRPLRRRAPEASPVPGAQGGVLPLRLRARPGGARALADRAGARARRAAPAAGRLALPPALQPALPADGRLP